MQSQRALALLALVAVPAALAAPTVAAAELTSDLQALAEDALAGAQQVSPPLPAAPSITILEEVYPTTLQEAADNNAFEPLGPDAEPMGAFVPRPMFDPDEPRPQSIFVTVKGEVREALVPPPISFTRPERLSAFDAGSQPKDTPFPPDYEDLTHDPRFDPCPHWQTLIQTSCAIVVLLFAATAATVLLERMLACMWRGVGGRRASRTSGILEAEPFLQEKHRRSRSDSVRSGMWSRSPSPYKISLA